MTPPSYTVLVAESNPQHADLHARWLDLSDYLIVQTAYSVEEANRHLNDDVDVLLTDWEFAVGHAPGMADARDRRSPECKLLVMTDRPPEPSDSRFDAVLAKPVSSADLGRAVAKLCGGTETTAGEWFGAPRSAGSS